MWAPILATSASPTGQSRQRRTLVQHVPSALRAVARSGVEVVLGEDAECRQRARLVRRRLVANAIVTRGLACDAPVAETGAGRAGVQNRGFA